MSKRRKCKTFIGYWIFDIRHLKFSKGGFTLVELLVYIGIFSILITVMAQIFSSIVDSQLDAETTTSVAQDGQYLYSRLIYDIHTAQLVASPSALGDSGPVLTLSKNGTSYTYKVNNHNLEVSTGSTSAALNSYDTEISNLQFQRIGNVSGKHTIRISFTITSKGQSQGGKEIRNFQTTAGLR